MNKFDVQLILGDLKVDGKLIFNERDLTIDTFKTTYVIKYININEYYCSDTGFIVKTDSKEYVFNTNEIDSIRKVLDDKLKPEKDIVIDGENDDNTKEMNITKVSDHLLFSDSNKYGTYNLYNSHLVVDYHEGHTKYENLTIKYNDIDDLDFHATSDPEYMFLYIVTNDGETYDFYFNKDKVDECRKVLEPRVTIEKEVYEDGIEDNNKSNQSNGAAIALTVATFIFIFGFIFSFYVIYGNNDKNELNAYLEHCPNVTLSEAMDDINNNYSGMSISLCHTNDGGHKKPCLNFSAPKESAYIVLDFNDNNELYIVDAEWNSLKNTIYDTKENNIALSKKILCVD